MAKKKNTKGGGPTVHPVIDNEQEIRDRLYSECYEENVKKQISNSENFDRSILTLSASGLGLSLVFIKDIAPLKDAIFRQFLLGSWIFFTAAIIATIVSFMTSQQAIRFQIDRAQKYYLERRDEYLNKTCLSARLTEAINFTAGATFIAAVVCTVVFVIANLP
jgi:hypothetical protein